MEQAASIDALDRIGGHPALDFVNTVGAWRSGQPDIDYLDDHEALRRWHTASGLLDRRVLSRLRRGDAKERRNVLRQARELRAVLYRLFAAIAAGRRAPQAALDELQTVLQRTVSWRRMCPASDRIVTGWDFTRAPPAALLGPVGWSAAELLQNGPLGRIKACPPGDGCGWLFLDLSKNRSRTWCSMKSCGNAAKVRRFRARH